MELVFYNLQGFSLSLTDNPFFFLTNVEGQTNAVASLSSIVIGGMDGDSVNNAQAQPRTIILDLRIKSGVNVEEAKREILSFIKLKQKGTLEWTQNNKTVRISGIVESVDMPRWNNSVTMQVSLHCEQPFWEDVEDVLREINSAISLHYFTNYEDDMLYFPAEGIPFGEYDMSRTRTFVNAGDVDVGMTIEIIAFATVTNPIMYDEYGNYFGCGYGTGDKRVVMNAGDVILITTHKGNKSIKLNGTSIIRKVKPNSTWLQLQAGSNTFTINSDDQSVDNMTFNVTYKQRYI